MDFEWSYFIDLGVIAAALLIATWIRTKVRFFQKFLIPNALTAGFILLPFYNFLAPLLGMRTGGLESAIYHLLSISFIAMALRSSTRKRRGRGVTSTATMILASLSIQSLVGLGLTFILIAAFFPDLFPSFGLFVPLGYELGPGQAFAIGQGWETFGFKGAGSVGLAFAAFGFLWACFGGIFLINWGVRKGWLSRRALDALKAKGLRSGVYARDAELPVGSRLTTESEAVETMAINLAVIMASYLLTYLLLKLLTYLLSFAGDEGRELAVNLWGISFLFATMIALGVRKIFEWVKADHILDDGTLTRVSGLAVDVLVAAAIGAISVSVVVKHWIPLLVIGLISGVVTILYVPWLASRLFRDHHFERAIVLYGGSTGTMPTGLALLRSLDPNFETPAAMDYMYAQGITFVLVIPFILAINLVPSGFADGTPWKYWAAFGLIGAYILVVVVLLFILGGKKIFRKPGRLWAKKGSPSR